jgi:hypothetical protein
VRLRADELRRAGRYLRDDARRLRQHDGLRYLPERPDVWVELRLRLHAEHVLGAGRELRNDLGRLWRHARLRAVRGALAVPEQRLRLERADLALDDDRSSAANGGFAGS